MLPMLIFTIFDDFSRCRFHTMLMPDTTLIASAARVPPLRVHERAQRYAAAELLARYATFMMPCRCCRHAARFLSRRLILPPRFTPC